MRISLFLCGLAMLGLCVAPNTFSQDTGRVAATWLVQSYDIEVTLPQDARSRSVTVKTQLSLKNVSQGPATTLTLRITPDADIKQVAINSGSVEFTKSEERVSSVARLQRVMTRMPSVAPSSEIKVTVDHVLNLKDNTAVSSLLPTSANFLPLGFWYPTPNSWFFTQGPDTAPVKLKVNAPAGKTVISAGTLTGGQFDQPLNGQPFFITGSWDVVEQDGIAVHIPKGLGADGQKRAGELATLVNEAKTFFESSLSKSADVKFRLVASRRGSGFGNGGTIIIDENVFRRTRIDSLSAMNLVESVARTWFGNSIKVNGDGYGAISEGLTRYFATQFIEKKYGKEVADVERMRQRTSYAAVSRRDLPISSVTPLDDFYYPVVANKGAMAWRILARRVGATEFADVIKKAYADGSLQLSEIRAGLVAQKELVDYLFDGTTDMNLLVGLPQAAGGETKVALRNTGTADVTVDVVAKTAGGESIRTSTTIKAASYSDIVIKTAERIVRVEVDAEKLYPQIDYSDDVAPRETTDSDLLLAAKRPFDKQDFGEAEMIAKRLLIDHPRFDDVRIILARAYLGQNKIADAAREFRAVLDEQLPTARSLAWANLGLGEIAARAGQNDLARTHANAAIAIDAEYGASLAARNLRGRLGAEPAIDGAIRSYFAEFDKAAASNRKGDLENLVVPGEVTRFVNGISGSTEQWQTQIRYVDRLDENTALVQADMSVKLLTRAVETGIAVYRVIRVGEVWQLMSVEMFEVR